ncbi:MAG: lysoplasmalogenase [Myxococcota bacterium]
MEVVAWVLATATAAVLAVWGRGVNRMPVHWIFKPLTTLIVLAFVAAHLPAGAQRRAACVALAFSALGDLLLMCPPRWFLPGLASFAIALGAYVWAFSLGVSHVHAHWLVLLLPVAMLAAALVPLMAHVGGRLRTAVAVYGAVLAILIWRLLVRIDAPFVGTFAYGAGVVGALLFAFGDTLLAYRRFAHLHVPYALELGTYYAAQGALALALVYAPT